MAARRNLLDRYAAGTTSLVVHAAVVGVMLLLFEPGPKPVAATLAITMPAAALEETQDVPESTDVVNAAPPPPLESPPTPRPIDPNEKPAPEAMLEPPRPLDVPPPITSTAPEATPAVPPPADAIVAQEPPPQPLAVQRRRAAPPAPRKPDPQPNTATPVDAAPAAPQVARAATGGNPGARSDYAGRVQARLQRNQIYPRDLRRGEHGTVVVNFTIDREGRVLASSIARGSGHTRLDEEAIATLRRSNPLPAPPSDIAGSQLQLTIPMNFTVPR